MADSHQLRKLRFANQSLRRWGGVGSGYRAVHDKTGRGIVWPDRCKGGACNRISGLTLAKDRASGSPTLFFARGTQRPGGWSKSSGRVRGVRSRWRPLPRCRSIFQPASYLLFTLLIERFIQRGSKDTAPQFFLGHSGCNPCSLLLSDHAAGLAFPVRTNLSW
jgi:hypothetical protein